MVAKPALFCFYFDGIESYLAAKYKYKCKKKNDNYIEHLDITFYVCQKGIEVAAPEKIELKLYKDNGEVYENMKFNVKANYVKEFSGDWGNTNDVMMVTVRFEVESVDKE